MSMAARKSKSQPGVFTKNMGAFLLGVRMACNYIYEADKGWLEHKQQSEEQK